MVTCRNVIQLEIKPNQGKSNKELKWKYKTEADFNLVTTLILTLRKVVKHLFYVYVANLEWLINIKFTFQVN